MPSTYLYRRLGSMPTCVYRCFDAEGRLLYVGCSINPYKRVAEHRGENHGWVYDLARFTVEVYPDRATAEWVERRAIRTEHPLWNSVRYKNTGDGPSPRNLRVLETDEFVLAEVGVY